MRCVGFLQSFRCRDSDIILQAGDGKIVASEAVILMIIVCETWVDGR